MSILCAGVLAVGEVWAGAGVPDEVMESLVRMKVMRPHVHGNRLYELSRHYELVLAGKESMRDYPYLAKLMSKTRFLGPRHAVDKTKLPEEVVRAFVEAGVDVNACEESERRENPLLIAARNYGATVCRLLLEAGADPNVQDAYGNTPLHNVCAYSDDAETARMLLAAGANPNVLNGLGQTPMELAMKNMRPGIAHALLDYGVRREDMKAHALDVAVFLGDAEGCRSEMAKVRQKTEAYTQALHLAAQLGHVEICRMLLEAGADANSMQELQNKTPSVTIKTVSTPLSNAAAGGHAEVCRLLLAAGADPNAATALINAAIAGHAEICRLLLEAGAKMGSAEGWHSPLFAAAYRGHIETCRVLIDALGKLGEKERLKMLNGALSPAIQEGKAEALRACLLAAKEYGLAGMPVKVRLKMLSCMLRYKMSFQDGVDLYGKYVGNWGGTATAWRFDAKKDGKVVASVTKCPFGKLHLEVRASHRSLTEGEVYDMAAVRVRILDEHDNLTPYAQFPVSFAVEGPVALVGPAVATAEGGACGCYLRTIGRTGEARVTVSAPQTEPVTVTFKVNA